MVGVTFRRSSRLAYSRPFDYEGDSIARDETLSIREQELDEMADLNVLSTLTSTAQYRRAVFIDELQASDSHKCQQLIYAHNHYEYFGRVWAMNWSAPEFLKNLKRAEHYFGIPLSDVRRDFDLTDPMLQVDLQRDYWEHMVEVLAKVESLSKKLQNLSNITTEADAYREMMEDESLANIWLSPFGSNLWMRFGLAI